MHNTPEELLHVLDAAVDDVLDAGIRALLCTCFTGPQDHVFFQRRYFMEQPAHRWLIWNRDKSGLAAHIAVHEKQIETGGSIHRIAGVAEVCVHPDWRGGGVVKHILAAMHPRLARNGLVYSVLFGSSKFYASSGYAPVANLSLDEETPCEGIRRVPAEVLVRPLAGIPWPADHVHLIGPRF